MDCEKFEAALMDELYGELDELTSAAMKRHASGCARCAALLDGLRATRRLAAIPPVEPPPELEARILEATRDAAVVVPFRRKLARGVSVAGRWAMRPQTAMAAVFLVMIGTSALLLTGKSARAPASAAVTVTEQGSPAPEVAAAEPAASAAAAPGATVPPSFAALDKGVAAAAASARPVDMPREENGVAHAAAKPSQPMKDDESAMDLAGALAAAAPPPPPVAAATAAGPAGGFGAGAASGGDADELQRKKAGTTPFNAAVQIYQAGRYDEAARAFDALAPSDANADLWAARSVREAKGCRASLARFDRVAGRASGTPVGWDALLEGALCYRAIGDVGNARTRLTALLGVDSHKDRARAELDRMNQSAGAGGGGAARAMPAPAPAAPPPASRPPPPSSAVDLGY
jgi:hypothetical protein